MLVEQLLFIFISFSIFVYMFFRMIKKNDTTYVIVLVLEAIGIALNFLEVLFDIELNPILKVLKYVLAVILPIGIIILEKQNIYLYEMINLGKARISLLFKNNKKAKDALINLLDKNKNSYNAHKLLAQIYEKEGGMRKAIDEYVQAIDINKQDYDSYYKVAELLNGLDKKQEAAEMLAISYSQFRALEKEGAFPFRRKLVGNKTVRYRNTDIYDYINAPDIQEKQTEGEAH